MNAREPFLQVDKMSPIFQTGYDDSSTDSIEDSENEVSNAPASGSYTSTDSIPRSGLETPMALARLNSHPQLPNIQPHQHSTLFYLSLIEGRCRTQAASAINSGRPPENHLPENHHEVQSLAQHLFGEMTKELHKAGVLPDEFAGRELSELRRTYLSSFDAILNNFATRKANEFQDNTYSSLFDRSNAPAIDGELLLSSFSNSNAFALQRYTMAAGQTIPSLSSLSLRDTVYKSQYKEVCLLGKGGFGKVYKAFHTLDGRDYAIKKVIMRGDILGGSTPQAKGEEFARELRTLARLNHPNIVRYHTSWAEKQPPELPGDSSSSSESGEESDAPETKLEFTEDMKPVPSKIDKHIKDHLARESRHVRQISRMINESRDGIVFGHSRSSAKTVGGSKRNHLGRNKKKALVPVRKSFFRSPQDGSDSSDSSDSSSGSDNKHSVDIAKSTEEIPRATEIIQSSAINFDVVLFIQMSLHPMNLEDYIWPEQQKSAETPIEHCYHSIPTARILLGILDGVEYIHSHNIVHRDLKPSNIMLSISENAGSFGSIKVSDCPDCRDDNCRELYITPHIGDFGLVADIQDPESDFPLPLEITISNDTLTSRNSTTTNTTTSTISNARMANNVVLPSIISSRPRANTDNKLVVPPALSGLSSRLPGTRFYAAPKATNGKRVICPKVDVYSLGVIALEMIYKFATRSERAVELDKLKDGRFPDKFDSHDLSDGIGHMLCKDRTQRWGCREVRNWLNTIIETAEQAKEAEEADTIIDV